MALKDLLDLSDMNISDCEIMAKVIEARKKGMSEVEFIKIDGSRVKIGLPAGMTFDPSMDLGS